MLCVAPVKWLRYFLATMIVKIWSIASVGRVLKIGQIWDFGRTDWTPLHFSDASLFSLSLGFRGIITPFMGRRKKTHLCRLTQSWNDYSLPPGEWRSLMPTPPDVLVSFATGANHHHFSICCSFVKILSALHNFGHSYHPAICQTVSAFHNFSHFGHVVREKY